ncbi:prolyl oligopeptidase family serine peptidase [Algiphilus sp.]|uniref:S9 family peptidase n=1 Tax=Algiphilus sp. TaxID=1872431 RepID=UPI002A5FB6E0|nr:prolyl oligopeptidase family serine peptidase [Pseudomonadota bacterium]
MPERRLPWGFWPGTLPTEALAAVPQLLGWAWDAERDVLAWAQWDPAAGRAGLFTTPLVDPARVQRIPDAEPRCRVHEYGGVPVIAGKGRWQWLWIDDASQGIHALDRNGAVHVLHAAPGRRCGDLVLRADGAALLFIEEDLVAEQTRLMRLDFGEGAQCRVMAVSDAFCAAPRWSPDGLRIAWISWSSTEMPWESSRLWVADAEGQGAHVVAGGAGISVLEPEWDARGRLWCLSDAQGWWWLSRVDAGGTTPLHRLEGVDMGRPPWQLGYRHYVLLPGGAAVVVGIAEARCRLLRLDPDGTHRELASDATDITQLARCGQRLLYLGAGPRHALGLWQQPLDGTAPATAIVGADVPVASEAVSLPEPVQAQGPAGAIHGYYYPPRYPGIHAEQAGPPPLILRAHGGPTAMRAPVFEPEVQFWTGRGFAVAELNYSGSSGHGRAYRERLRGRWGLLDRDDCRAMARALVDQGRAQAGALFIAGNSAGGLSVLNSLRGVSPFAAGLCRWGVADLERLAACTHRFERGYLNHLVGALPEARAAYRWRSPVHHAARIAAPLIMIQGREDRIVPPAQAEAMAAAVAAQGGLCALHLYPDEGHGLRQAAHRAHAVEAEWAFLQRLLAAH